jgi:hypothetical protein
VDAVSGRRRTRGERFAVENVARCALVQWAASTVALVALANCGAEVAGSAATVAATQAAQASQARAQQAEIADGFFQAQDGAADRATSAADEAGNNAADVGQLLPMLKTVQDNTGQTPAQALADAGYRSEENFAGMAGSATELVVALGREGERCAEITAAHAPRVMLSNSFAFGSVNALVVLGRSE